MQKFSEVFTRNDGTSDRPVHCLQPSGFPSIPSVGKRDWNCCDLHLDCKEGAEALQSQFPQKLLIILGYKSWHGKCLFQLQHVMHETLLTISECTNCPTTLDDGNVLFIVLKFYDNGVISFIIRALFIISKENSVTSYSPWLLLTVIHEFQSWKLP